ncbi:MAG TPA: diacylglycerol kinase family protein [Candidatus Nanopelagicales bacterium]|jgi:diacylglycerol kinase family enzyme
MSVAVIVHPGKVGDLDRARSTVDEVATSVGVARPMWFETSAADPGPGQARRAIEEGATVVIAWGGDGTLMGVASALVHGGASLGIVPGGTGNLLARNLGIPLDARSALEVALTGPDRGIDLLDVYLGRGERRLSAVMSGMGWDADMMGAPEALKRRVGWGAYVLQGARHLHERPMRLRLSIDGGPELQLYGRTVLVANVGRLVAGLDLIPEAQPDDGLLDVLVIDPSTPRDWARTTAGILRGKGAETDPSRTQFRGREVIVSTNHPHSRQVDGDPVDAGQGFRVSMLEQALSVRVPSE